MESCTVYSHQADIDVLLKKVMEVFPAAQYGKAEKEEFRLYKFVIKGQYFTPDKSLQINYRQRDIPSYKLEEAMCPLTSNLIGMYNFIGSIPASNADVQEQLMRKVDTINSEFTLIAEPGFTGDMKKLLDKIATDLDAIIFAPPGTSISKSEGQHFLDKSLDLILDVNGRSNVNKIDISINSKYYDSIKEGTPAQVGRKKHSEELLSGKGIPVNKNLPFTVSEEEVKLRSKEEVIERTYALLTISAMGEGVEKEQLDKLREKHEIKSLSPFEEYLYNKEELTQQERAMTTWRYEGLNVMLWALGYLDYMEFPTVICDVAKIVGIVIGKSREEFVQDAKLRNATEMLDQLDRIYRMNWACVNERLKGKSAPAGLEEGVVYERHYALNWLTSYQNADWDNIKTNT